MSRIKLLVFVSVYSVCVYIAIYKMYTSVSDQSVSVYIYEHVYVYIYNAY